jgi:peptide/nickel transport system substrate-binding protein
MTGGWRCETGLLIFVTATCGSLFMRRLIKLLSHGRSWAAVCCVAVGVACGTSAKADSTLNAVLESEITTLDPMRNTAYINRTFGFLVYDTLFGMDSAMHPQPQMVERWSESEDHLRWSFTLRPGLKWHDGSAVTAADCVASLERWEPRDPLGRLLASATATMAADNERSFTIVLNAPYPLMLDTLGKPASIVPFMMPAKLAKTPPDQSITTVDGSGPFVFRADLWRPGNSMVFDRNPSYVPRPEAPDFLAGGKTVKIDHLVLHVIPDTSTQVSALLLGEIDYLQYVPFDWITRLEKTPGLKLIGLDGLGAFGGSYIINHATGPFADPAVRRVLWKLVNQQAVLAAIGVPPGFARLDCKSYWLCGTPLSTDAGSSVAHYSIDEARADLAKTAYKGESVIIMEWPDNPTQMAASAVLVDGMRRAGFTVEEQSMDFATILARRTKKEGWSLLAMWSYGFDLGNPLTHFYVANNCADYPGWSCDPRITALMPKFAAATTDDQRRQIAAQIQEAAYDSVPSVMWGQFVEPGAYKASLRGLIQSSIPVFWGVSP